MIKTSNDAMERFLPSRKSRFIFSFNIYSKESCIVPLITDPRVLVAFAVGRLVSYLENTLKQVGGECMGNKCCKLFALTGGAVTQGMLATS